MLVACGQSAIGPLRRFLLEGTPSSIFVPRQRAARARARLMAKDVLLEYLRRDREISDPTVAHGEEAVSGLRLRPRIKLKMMHCDSCLM
jgi:hypothetical protein